MFSRSLFSIPRNGRPLSLCSSHFWTICGYLGRLAVVAFADCSYLRRSESVHFILESVFSRGRESCCSWNRADVAYRLFGHHQLSWRDRGHAAEQFLDGHEVDSAST